jgi:small subunit ribosomal protein S3Ae
MLYSVVTFLNVRSFHFQVKVLKKPRFELSKLLELHGDGKGGSDEPGAKVDRPEGYEPPVQESV